MRWVETSLPTAAQTALGFADRTWDKPQFLALGHTTTTHRMRTAVMPPPSRALPLPQAPHLAVDELVVHDPLLERAVPLAVLLERRLHCDGLLVFHGGGVRHESYRGGFSADDVHLLHSCSKTLTTMMVGIAAAEGRLALDAPVRSMVPELADAWQAVTVQHVLDMATGIFSEEHYDDANGMYWRYAPAVGYYGDTAQGEGVLAFLTGNLTQPVAAPGSVFNYASYVTNLLPVILERVYDEHPVALYERTLFQRIGAEQPGLINCDCEGRPIVEGQVSLTLRDFARWALLYLHQGRNLEGEQVVPQAWVQDSFTASAANRAAFARGEQAELFPEGGYHNQLWLPDADRGIAAMLGIHGQFAYFDLPRGLLIVGVSSYPTQLDGLMTECLQTVWRAISEAVES